MIKLSSALALLVWLTTPLASIAEVNDEAILARKPLRSLSEYGFFDDLAKFTANDALVPYTLNAPLFTDYADKFRFIYVPSGAAPAQYQTTSALNFPVGSALIKTFAYPDANGGMRNIETRVLLHKENGWVAYPYIWNDEQDEAALKVAGGDVIVEMTPPNGTPITIEYHVPNVNQCKGCHVNAQKEFMPIGPKIRNMNTVEDSSNQLDRLVQASVLASLPDNRADLPLTPSYSDPSNSLDVRAKAYLDANCAHCHALGSPADTSGLFLTWEETDPTHRGINKPPVAAGRGSGGLDYDVVPGQPEESILVYRMDSVDPGIMMPELGRGLIDRAGVQLISDYISSIGN